MVQPSDYYIIMSTPPTVLEAKAAAWRETEKVTEVFCSSILQTEIWFHSQSHNVSNCLICFPSVWSAFISDLVVCTWHIKGLHFEELSQ